MILRASGRSRTSLSTSSAFPPSPNPPTSSSLPWSSKFSSVRVNVGVSSSQVLGDLSSRRELRLNCAAKLNRVREIGKCRKRNERSIVVAFGSRSKMPVFSMPTPIGSASFYPVRGVFYFLNGENRVFLWKRIAKFAAEVGAASVAIFGALVGFTFHTQRGLLLQVVPHFFGTPGTIVLILVETAIPMVLLFYKRLQRTQEKLFDDVLRLENVQVESAASDEREWIDEQRELQCRQNQQVSREPSIFNVFTDPSAMNDRPVTKYFLTLPLNFIPVAGNAVFCWLNAMDVSTGLHHHYYSRLKGLSAEEEATIIQYRKNQYQQFGVMATALTLLPGFDIILVLTNAVGAALWVADIERALQKSR